MRCVNMYVCVRVTLLCLVMGSLGCGVFTANGPLPLELASLWLSSLSYSKPSIFFVVTITLADLPHQRGGLPAGSWHCTMTPHLKKLVYILLFLPLSFPFLLLDLYIFCLGKKPPRDGQCALLTVVYTLGPSLWCWAGLTSLSRASLSSSFSKSLTLSH